MKHKSLKMLFVVVTLGLSLMTILGTNSASGLESDSLDFVHTNYIDNYSFETDLTGWSSDASSFSRSNTAPKFDDDYYGQLYDFSRSRTTISASYRLSNVGDFIGKDISFSMWVFNLNRLNGINAEVSIYLKAQYYYPSYSNTELYNENTIDLTCSSCSDEWSKLVVGLEFSSLQESGLSINYIEVGIKIHSYSAMFNIGIDQAFIAITDYNYGKVDINALSSSTDPDMHLTAGISELGGDGGTNANYNREAYLPVMASIKHYCDFGSGLCDQEGLFGAVYGEWLTSLNSVKFQVTEISGGSSQDWAAWNDKFAAANAGTFDGIELTQEAQTSAVIGAVIQGVKSFIPPIEGTETALKLVDAGMGVADAYSNTYIPGLTVGLDSGLIDSSPYWELNTLSDLGDQGARDAMDSVFGSVLHVRYKGLSELEIKITVTAEIGLWSLNYDPYSLFMGETYTMSSEIVLSLNSIAHQLPVSDDGSSTVDWNLRTASRNSMSTSSGILIIQETAYGYSTPRQGLAFKTIGLNNWIGGDLEISFRIRATSNYGSSSVTNFLIGLTTDPSSGYNVWSHFEYRLSNYNNDPFISGYDSGWKTRAIIIPASSLANAGLTPGSGSVELMFGFNDAWKSNWDQKVQLDYVTIDVPAPPPPPPPSLGDAVDNTAPSWTTSGNADWFYQGTTYFFDNDAAQAGAIGNWQSTSMQAVISFSEITFVWKVSSETNYDYLRFFIDGVEKDRISGEVGWQQKTYFVSSGSHTVEWRYTKDGSLFRGSDTGWVDAVSYS